MKPATDLNLLFGILALQMDFVSREQLITAMNAWVLAKHQSLGEVLLEQQALAADTHALLDALVQKHLALHHDDPQQSLAALSSIGPLRHDLEQLADPDLQASLAHVSAARETDTPPTASWHAGTPTSGGVRFRVLRPHARGGLGEVFVANDEELNREVALKRIQDGHADNPQSRKRFVLEAEITGGLEHPGIVPVYGLGTYADGRPFYAMRFIRGHSLKEAIAQFHQARAADSQARALELRQLLGRFIDVCQAMQYAHDRGVLHRDLKPGNIMLGKYGETLVVDWGLAKPLGKREAASEEPTLRVGSSTETMTGAALGTPAFMSPEQAAGRVSELSPASDVYSLGATLFCLLTGKTPIQDSEVQNQREADKAKLLDKVRRGDFPRPRQLKADLDLALEAVCLKAMSLKPGDRYASPRGLADDLEHWLAGEPVSAWPEPWTVRAGRWARRNRPLIAAAAALLVTATVALTIATYLLDQKQKDTDQARGAAEHNAGLYFQEQQTAKEEAANARAAAGLAKQKQGEAETAQQQAETARGEAVAKQKEAEDARRETEKALASTRLALSNSYITRAHEAFHKGDLKLASELLRRCSPETRGWDWHYLQRLAHGGALTFHDLHTCVTFSPDGRWLASLADGGTIRVLNLGDGTTIDLKGDAKEITQLHFSPDAKLLAVVAADHTVRLWDVAARKVLQSFPDPSRRTKDVSPDGRLSAYWERSTPRVRDQETDEEIARGPAGGSSYITFSSDGRLLLLNWSTIWDFREDRVVMTIPPSHRSTFLSAQARSPDGTRLAIEDSKVILGDPVMVRVRDLGKDQVLFSFPMNAGRNAGLTGDGTKELRFSPDGRLLADASEDWKVRVRDGRTGQLLQEHGVAPFKVPALEFSPDGRWLAAAGTTLQLWPTRGGESGSVLIRGAHDVHHLAFSPDGSRLAAAATADSAVTVWDAASGQPLQRLATAGFPFSVAWSPDGRYLATGTGSSSTAAIADPFADGAGEVRLWDPETGKVLGQKWSDLPGRVSSLAFSPDSKRLAGGIGTLKVGYVLSWDPVTGEEVQRVTTGTIATGQVAFAPDGASYFSVGELDRKVRSWATDSGELRSTIVPHANNPHSPACAAAYTSDGRYLVTGGAWVNTFWNRVNQGEGEIKLWDRQTTQAVRMIRGVSGAVTALAVSPDGRRLVTGDSKGNVQLWDLATGQLVFSLLEAEPPASPRQRTNHINAVGFSPDGRRLAAAGSDGVIRVWDGLPLPEVLAYRREGGPQTWEAWGPDRHRLVSRDVDGVLRVVEAQTGRELTVASPRGQPVAAHHVDRERLAVAELKAVRVLDVRTGTPLFAFTEDGVVALMRYSADGRRLATLGVVRQADGTGSLVIRVRDGETGEELSRFAAPPGKYQDAELDAELARARLLDDRNKRTVWDLDSGKEVAGAGSFVAALEVVWDTPGRQLVAVRGTNNVPRDDRSALESFQVLDLHMSPAARSVPFRPDVLWHVREAEAAASAEDRYALAFHLGRVASADSAVVSLGARVEMLLRLGDALLRLRRHDMATQTFDRVFEMLGRMTRERPDDPAPVLQEVRVCATLAQNLAGAGKTDEAEKYYRRAAASAEAAAARHPNRAEGPLYLAEVLSRLAELIRHDPQRTAEAEALYARTREQLLPLVEKAPKVVNYRRQLAHACLALGQLRAENGKREEAVRALEQCAAEWKTLAQQHEELSSKDPPKGVVVNPEVKLPLEYRSGPVQAQAELLLLKGDHAGAAKNAEALAKLALAGPTEVYNAACLTARCAPLVEKDEALTPEKRQELVKSLSDRAMAHLRASVDKGFRNPRHIQNDPDLKSLRERRDFKKLLEDLSKPPAQPKTPEE
jgi:WD40 repeat protein/tRNA A-37 threonylcarbamoyl transferase component Bud32